MIIVVGVSIETVRQVQGRMAQQNYQTFVTPNDKKLETVEELRSEFE